MGEEYKEKWYDFLPWILLLKRSSFQKELGASPAMMTYGTNLAIPGDLLRDPGDPLSETEMQKLLQFVNTIDHNTPTQPTKIQTEVPEPPNNVTHVYTKQYNTTGLQAPYMGPFPVVSRPSRTQVKIQVGLDVRGHPRYELRNWKDLKIGHLRPDATDASRPKRGRPSANAGVPPLQAEVPPEDSTSSGSEAANSNEQDGGKVNKLSASPSHKPVEQIQIQCGRPQRSTRNPSPLYVDSIGPPPMPPFLAGNSNNFNHPKTWSASKEEMDQINNSINHRHLG